MKRVGEGMLEGSDKAGNKKPAAKRVFNAASSYATSAPRIRWRKASTPLEL